METKSFTGEFKAAADGEPRAPSRPSSRVFGNVDSYGDRMVKGAFARTLEEKGMPPVVWSHEWATPPIGNVESATETDEGLLIKGRLFIAPTRTTPSPARCTPP
jgi:HK97 family phage prohead protease